MESEEEMKKREQTWWFMIPILSVEADLYTSRESKVASAIKITLSTALSMSCQMPGDSPCLCMYGNSGDCKS